MLSKLWMNQQLLGWVYRYQHWVIPSYRKQMTLWSFQCSVSLLLQLTNDWHYAKHPTPLEMALSNNRVVFPLINYLRKEELTSWVMASIAIIWCLSSFYNWNDFLLVMMHDPLPCWHIMDTTLVLVKHQLIRNIIH